jgi:hypothetical protein
MLVKSQSTGRICILLFKLPLAFKEMLVSFYCSIAADFFAQRRKVSAIGLLN